MHMGTCLVKGHEGQRLQQPGGWQVRRETPPQGRHCRQLRCRSRPGEHHQPLTSMPQIQQKRWWAGRLGMSWEPFGKVLHSMAAVFLCSTPPFHAPGCEHGRLRLPQGQEGGVIQRREVVPGIPPHSVVQIGLLQPQQINSSLPSDWFLLTLSEILSRPSARTETVWPEQLIVSCTCPDHRSQKPLWNPKPCFPPQ